MSPPDVWGPAIWTLFHTISEKINENAYPYVINSMFSIICRICSFLPCPECSKHATSFLAKINIKDYKTKNDFKNMIYLFHNLVNAKKRKPLFNYANMNKYAYLNLQIVVNNFIANYNTKGNMKLLSETFQRTIIIKDFINWFKFNSKAFLPTRRYQPRQQNQENDIKVDTSVIVSEETKQILSEEQPIVEEPNKEEEIIVEEPNKEEENIVEEPNKEEENIVEEPIKEEENIVEEPIKEEENIVEEPIKEELVTQEPVIEEN